MKVKFEVGDRVKCIRPKSEVYSRYDLEPDRTYIVDSVRFGSLYFDHSNIGYDQNRFILVDDLEELVDDLEEENVDFFLEEGTIGQCSLYKI